MDFSSLDLLASTALRDNNPTQTDKSSTPTEPHHPQHNHHNSSDNDEDDDEADGNKEGVKETETTTDSDFVQSEMGSVKCGKHKKNSAKPMSILVRDGKCVAKHLSTDSACQKRTGSEVAGDKKTGSSHKVNPVKQEGDICPQNMTVHCNTSLKCPTQTVEIELKPANTTHPKCKRIHCPTHQKTEAAACDKNTLQLVASQRDAAGTALPCSSVKTESSCDSRVKSCAETSEDPGHGSAGTCVPVEARDCDAREREDSEVTRDFSLTPNADPPACEGGQSALSDRQARQDEGSDCSHTVTADDTGDTQTPVLQMSSDTLSTRVLQTSTDSQSSNVLVSSPQMDKGEETDSVPSELLDFSVLGGAQGDDATSSESEKKTETAVNSKTPNICDEDLAMSSCSRSTVQVVHEQNSPCKNSLDQEMGSSGNKELNPSTSAKNSNVNCILSPPPPPPLPHVVQSLALLDHTYCLRSKVRVLENTDDSGDAFESADENVSADEIERRPRSLSVDSVYLQSGLVSLPTQQEGMSQTDKLALLSPTLSVDSVSNDSSLSEHSTAAGGQCYSILVGSPNPKGTSSRPTHASADSQGGAEGAAAGTDSACRLGSSTLEPAGNSSVLDSNTLMAVGPKCGKFRIGTFGSFSNSHLDLEKESKKGKLKNGLSSDSVIKTSLSSPAMASPGSPFPLLQSPGMEWDRSDAGSEGPDDLDSSTTEDKFLSSSHDSEAFGTTVSQIWRHPVFHDHDYCCKEVSEEYLGKPVAPTPPLKTGKRKYVKKKDRLDSEEEKLRKGKYLKRELLKQDNRFNLGAGRGAESRTLTAKSSLLSESLTTKPNPVGRPRKRAEKQLEEYDAETGTKMKITGKYQDQYVYYLNKSSRNRRRKLDEKISPGDKIILPAPKPGDIVVPHLSDADCEAIRRGGRMALLNSSPHPASSVHLPHTDSGDMDSSIVNTILSMETEHGNLHSPLDAYDGVGNAEDFGDIEGNLTSEQVKMLFDCLEDYQMEETTTSQELDLFTSAEAVSIPSTTVNSLAVTSMGEDSLVSSGEPAASNTCITGPASCASLLTKVDPGSPAPEKMEPDSLACNVKADMEHSETKALVSRGLPVPPTSQPSVEKNLEFLKTPFTRSDFFPTVSSVTSSASQGLFTPTPQTSLTSPIPEIKSDDVNETPWIVTVTLYWNDIPAIVINNMPHVRLVDIHRQILPAKDTGILKKRCQLMNIPVSNCTEMQRYFLVQYGRAHNSKSTLVISKDEAQRLITYYAHPPPRNLRSEEGTGLRRSSSYAELRSIMERPSNPGRHSTLAFNQPRKRGGFRRRPMPTRSHNPSPEPLVPTVTPVMEPLLASPQPAAPASPAKGLRHKKINFREMLKGEDFSPQMSPLMDSVDQDTALLKEASVAKGKGSKQTGGTKRRGSKEMGGGSPAKRGRKAWRKKKEGKQGSQEAPTNSTEAEVTDDKDSSSTTVMSSKNKKRSPGSSASGSLGTSGRSPKSKFGPIKVNVKSLVNSGGSISSDGSQPRKKNLFGRKSSSTDVVVDASEAIPHSNPLRVLRISHQDVEATSPPTSKILSPMAEVHLDLYKRASSPCVKCQTCHKFLSVPGFLKHQHVSGEDNTAHSDMSHSQQRRMLVPMNKENISLEEQRLWNEFIALQESLDHSVSMASIGTYPLTPLSPASPVGSSLHVFGEVRSPVLDETHLITMTPESPHPPCLHNGHDDTVLDMESTPHCDPEFVTVMGKKCPTPPDNEPSSGSDVTNVGDFPFATEAASHPWDTPLPCSPPSLLPQKHTQNEEKYVENSVESNDKEVASHPKTVSPSSKKQWTFQRPRRFSSNTSIRTSSRKRETKRLFGFEKYEFGVGGKKGGRGEADTQDFAKVLPDTLLDDVDSVVMNNNLVHLAPATALHEPQNA